MKNKKIKPKTVTKEQSLAAFAFLAHISRPSSSVKHKTVQTHLISNFFNSIFRLSHIYTIFNNTKVTVVHQTGQKYSLVLPLHIT